MVEARRSVVGKMRRRELLLAGLCMLCACQHACAEDPAPGLRESLARNVLESAAGTLGEAPVEMFIQDAYPVVVRGGLKRLYQSLKSLWLTLAYGDVEEVSDMVMEKLRVQLFGTRRVQATTWNRMRNSFRDYLRDWWLTTPLVPAETLKTGVWRALLKLAADDLSELLTGTEEYEKLKDLVLDEKRNVIDHWVDDIQRRLTQGELEGGDEQTHRRKRSHSTGRRAERTARRSSTHKPSHGAPVVEERNSLRGTVQAVQVPANPE